jgi:hypothetical protein
MKQVLTNRQSITEFCSVYKAIAHEAAALVSIDDFVCVGRRSAIVTSFFLLCSSVNLEAQLRMRDEELGLREKLSWGGNRTTCRPINFAGKFEDCSDSTHQPKKLEMIDLRISAISEETMYMGSESDKEMFCTVSGAFVQNDENQIEGWLSASKANCDVFKKVMN